MHVRRTLALLLTAAVWGTALTIPAMMLAEGPLDPLAPIAPLARLDHSLPDRDDPLMLPLHRQASAALNELQAAAEGRTSRN